MVELVTAPDGVWDEVGRWARHRLTAALVAAIGVIQGEPDEMAAGTRPPPSATGHRPADWVNATATAGTTSDGR